MTLKGTTHSAKKCHPLCYSISVDMVSVNSVEAILANIINPSLQPQLTKTILTAGGAFTDLSAAQEICPKEADV